MQEKIQIEIEKEVYDMIQAIKEIIPAENGGEIDDNEALKMIIGTFMAIIEDNNGHSHEGGCGCGGGHCHN